MDNLLKAHNSLGPQRIPRLLGRNVDEQGDLKHPPCKAYLRVRLGDDDE